MNLEQRISNLERHTSTTVGTPMQDGDPVKFYVNNRTGSTITKGQVVYISGASGNKVTIALAKANAESTSSKTFGVAEADIADNASGWIVTAGQIEKLDTSAYADGDTLYLSPITAGAWATTKPSAPNHLVYVGFVSRAHATVGSIFVRCQNGYELDEIHDVSITSKTDNDLLVYESSSGLWKNKQRKVLPTSGRIELKNTTSTQSLTNATATTIGATSTANDQWTSAENIGSIFTLGTTTGLITCNTAGRVSIYGKIKLDSNIIGQRILQIVRNGTEQIGALTVGAQAATSIAVSIPSFRLAANDTLELRVYQDSGTARALAASTTFVHYFIVEYLGA